MKLRAGTIKRITVNRHVIASNKKTGANEPVFSVQTSNGAVRAHLVRINGPSSFIYNPNNPLKCGATAWVRTNSEVELYEGDPI